MSAAGTDASLSVPAWRRTVGVISVLTGVAAVVGSVQLVTDTFTS